MEHRVETAADGKLVDSLNRPLQDLRISVTDRCNFRCGYCMPKDVFGKGYPFLKPSSLLSYNEIHKLVSVFSELGVSKIRLTGGEPLLRKDLESLVERLAGVDGINDIALTTNASLLTAERCRSLSSAGVKRINISLDALTPEIYKEINQIPVPLEDILRGVKSALDSDFDTVKVNMVVQKGVNETDILPMAKYFRNTGVVLRFIEFMDVGNYNQWNMDKVFTASEIVELLSAEFPLEPVDPNYRGEVARRWRYLDGQGEIGVIASITQPFCGDCARARLSAKGELFTCLFASSGFNLKTLLEQGATHEDIRDKLVSVWSSRDDQYSMLRKSGSATGASSRNSQKVEMSYIGG